jgi:hypothetical protein
MSKSRKKKSSKKQKPGKTLAVLAFIISLGALGLGLYQIFAPSGPTIYNLVYDDLIEIDDISVIDYLSELSLTYSAKEGDRILIEFSCEILINPSTSTDFTLNFDIQGAIFPSSRIRIYTDSYTRTNGYMKHYIESSGAGLFQVQIYATIDNEWGACWVDSAVLTVTIY